MSMYHVEMGFLVTGYGTEAALDEHLDCVLDALLEDDRAVDPDYTATLSSGTVEFSLNVEADDEPRALELVLFVLRAAIHGAQGCTKDWDAHFEEIQTLIRKAQLVTA